MYNSTAPLAAVDLSRSTNRQANTRVSKQRRAGTAVHAGIKVDVGTVLVGIRQTRLGTQWVSTSRTQIVNHDDDAVACIGKLVAGRVGLNSQLPAGTASRTLTISWTSAVQILRNSGAVAGLSVEEAGGSIGVAVT